MKIIYFRQMKRKYFAGHQYVEFSKGKIVLIQQKKLFSQKNLKNMTKGPLAPLRMTNAGKHRKSERSVKATVLREQLKGLKFQ